MERKLVTLTVHEKLMQQKKCFFQQDKKSVSQFGEPPKKSSPNPLGFPGNQPFKEWLPSDG